ncbi:MAG TPA: hypothetical protein VF522_18955 [Ramlibacter sp.]|uniref:hypothetical protein n=1 Tax=Ramlibacter sp. TaxID=1917967 RepID=UPI002ED24DD9
MAAIEKIPKDHRFLEREYRPIGVELNLQPTMDALALLDAHPGWRIGFAHALTGLIAAGLPSSDVVPYGPDELRKLTAEACIGPGTFDAAAWQSSVTAAPGGEETSYRDQFMAGVRHCADMLGRGAEVREQDGDAAEIQAGYRGPAVAQNRFVRPFFSLEGRSAAFKDGFAASLSSFVAEHAEEDGGEFRSITFEEIHGGPDVLYMSNDDPNTVFLGEISERVFKLRNFKWSDKNGRIEQARSAAADMTGTIVLSEARAALQVVLDSLRLAHAEISATSKHLPAGNSVASITNFNAELLDLIGRIETYSNEAAPAVATTPIVESQPAPETEPAQAGANPDDVRKGPEFEADWQVIVDPPTFDDPRRTAIAEALSHLNYYTEALEELGSIGDEASDLVSQLHEDFWPAVRGMRTGVPTATLETHVHNMRAILAKVVEVTPKRSAGRLLASACIERLDGDAGCASTDATTTDATPDALMPERKEIAFFATIDIDPLLQKALEIVAGEGARAMMPEDHSVLKALLLRAARLADVAFDALSEDETDLDQLREVLSGAAE